MGNQVAVNAHTQPGQEVILEADAHIFYYEAAGPALLSGVQLRPLPGRGGVLTAADVARAVRPENVHFPVTSLVCLENTHNRAGGTIYPIDEIRKIRQIAKEEGIKMHLDGARLWNASIATGIPLHEYADCFDSLSVCFSKGLGAPVGSLVAGDADFIKRAHKYRKIYGGGMRQVGIIAAGALYAMEHHFERLKEDHANAKKLAEAIADLSPFSISLDSVQTNIVIIRVDESRLKSADAAVRLNEMGIQVLSLGPGMLRAVTHLEVSAAQIDEAIQGFYTLANSI
jgi:threonine aldolase